MITAHKQLLTGTPGDVGSKVEYLARDQDDHEYLAGTWFRELAVILAECDGLTVSAVSYDDTAGYEHEVTLAAAPHHDPIVIGRSQPGDHCHITLERWLLIDGEPDIENAVNTFTPSWPPVPTPIRPEPSTLREDLRHERACLPPGRRAYAVPGGHVSDPDDIRRAVVLSRAVTVSASAQAGLTRAGSVEPE